MLNILKLKTPSHKDKNGGHIFALLAFFVAFGVSINLPVLPIILKDILGSKTNVGFYQSIINFSVVIFFILSPLLFMRHSKIKIVKISFLIYLLFCLSLPFIKNYILFGFLDLVRIVCIMTIRMSLHYFIADFFKKQKFVKEKGLYFFYANIGNMAGFLTGGYIAKFFGNQNVFIFSSISMFMGFIYFNYVHLFEKNKYLHNKKNKIHIIKNTIGYFKNPERTKAFMVSLGLSFFAAVFNIYVPLTIAEKGYTQDIIGWFLLLRMFPVLIYEKIMSSRLTVKKIKIYSIMSFLSYALFYILTGIFYNIDFLVFIFLILINIGTGMLEPTRDLYFNSTINVKEKEKYFGTYKLSISLANVVSPLLISFVLTLFFKLEYVYVFSGVLFLLFVVLSNTIKIGNKNT